MKKIRYLDCGYKELIMFGRMPDGSWRCFSTVEEYEDAYAHYRRK